MGIKDKSLKDLMAEFEAVVAWFDDADLDVEKATRQFEKGAKLAEEIQTRLVEAKNKIEVVKKRFDVE